jgi:hypothetical protein
LENYRNEGILFSSDLFSDEAIARLAQPREDSTADGRLRGQAATPAVSAGNPEEAFAAAWAEMSADPEFRRAMEELAYTRDQGLADFQRALGTTVSAELDTRTSEAIAVHYHVAREGDALVHRAEGQPVLVIPHAHPSAHLISANAQVTLLYTFVVIDAIALIAAAAGIVIPIRKTALAPIMESELGALFKEVRSPMAVEWQRLIKGGKTVDGISKLMAFLRGKTSLKDVVDKFCNSLDWKQKAIAAVQLLACIIALVASFGASLAWQIAALTASIAILVTDVVALVNAV